MADRRCLRVDQPVARKPFRPSIRDWLHLIAAKEIDLSGRRISDANVARWLTDAGEPTSRSAVQRYRSREGFGEWLRHQLDAWFEAVMDVRNVE